MTETSTTVRPESFLNPEKKVHPYRDTLEKTLAKQKHMKFLLEERIRLIDIKFPDTQFMTDALPNYTEWIDSQITKVKTQGEIDVLNRVIEEKQKYFDNYIKQYEKDVEDVKLHYKTVVALAHKSTKPAVKSILSTVIWERVEEDDEKRIALYKQLKKYI